MTSYTKDPSAILDYTFEWADYLEDGETISSHTVTADDGITIASSSLAGDVVTAWISGGRAGFVYRVVCTIVTSVGASPAPSPAIYRTDQRTLEVVCADS